MEEGKGERHLAPGRQYGNALLGVRHQEEEDIGTEGSGCKCAKRETNNVFKSCRGFVTSHGRITLVKVLGSTLNSNFSVDNLQLSVGKIVTSCRQLFTADHA